MEQQPVNEHALFATILTLWTVTLCNIGMGMLQRGDWRPIQQQGLTKFEYMLDRLGFIASFSLLVMPLQWYKALIAKKYDEEGIPKNYNEQEEILKEYKGRLFELH